MVPEMSIQEEGDALPYWQAGTRMQGGVSGTTLLASDDRLVNEG